jgi:hypothetical protein
LTDWVVFFSINCRDICARIKLLHLPDEVSGRHAAAGRSSHFARRGHGVRFDNIAILVFNDNRVAELVGMSWASLLAWTWWVGLNSAGLS